MDGMNLRVLERGLWGGIPAINRIQREAVLFRGCVCVFTILGYLFWVGGGAENSFFYSPKIESVVDFLYKRKVL